MFRPYGLISDLHASNWSSFATIDDQGRNSRLMEIVHGIHRCCEEVRQAGGNTVVIAGDVFHERGKVVPSVFNPIRDAFTMEIKKHTKFIGIPGNHDSEGKDVKRLTSAVAMLERDGVEFVHNVLVIEKPCLALFPYQGNGAATLKAMRDFAEIENAADLAQTDAIIHCGIDGTLRGVPDHGFSATDLAGLGFRRVFAGDYHHAKEFGNGVFSIGSLTHQTWSDVDTKAGFWVIHEDREQWFASHAPNFIDITGEEDPDELPLIVDGHYVRYRVGAATAASITNARELLIKMGARGVLIHSVPTTVIQTRAGVSTKSLASIDHAVSEYVKEQGMSAQVDTLCAEIMKEAQEA